MSTNLQMRPAQSIQAVDISMNDGTQGSEMPGFRATSACSGEMSFAAAGHGGLRSAPKILPRGHRSDPVSFVHLKPWLLPEEG